MLQCSKSCTSLGAGGPTAVEFMLYTMCLGHDLAAPAIVGDLSVFLAVQGEPQDPGHALSIGPNPRRRTHCPIGVGAGVSHQ
jgi:hypothetical protein